MDTNAAFLTMLAMLGCGLAVIIIPFIDLYHLEVPLYSLIIVVYIFIIGRGVHKVDNMEDKQ